MCGIGFGVTRISSKNSKFRTNLIVSHRFWFHHIRISLAWRFRWRSRIVWWRKFRWFAFLFVSPYKSRIGYWRQNKFGIMNDLDKTAPLSNHGNFNQAKQNETHARKKAHRHTFITVIIFQLSMLTDLRFLLLLFHGRERLEEFACVFVNNNNNNQVRDKMSACD